MGPAAELEAGIGPQTEITADKLRDAIALVEGKRQALQRLLNIRKARPAPISGLDALLVIQISFYDDVARFTEKVNELCDELEERVRNGVGVAPADAPRILICGAPMVIPNWKVPAIVEGAGAVVVCEESCVGTRYIRNLSAVHVPTDGSLEEMMRALAQRQLETHCACFTPNQERIDDIRQLAREYQADGVIHYTIQFCQIYANEAVKVERAMEADGVRVLCVETDYGSEDVEQLRTRIEAFLELLKR